MSIIFFEYCVLMISKLEMRNSTDDSPLCIHNNIRSWARKLFSLCCPIVANCSVTTDSGSSLEQSPLHRGPNVELRYAV